MTTSALVTEPGKQVDAYLGFEIRSVAGTFVAVPAGWTGDVLWTDTLPHLRKLIWCWWFRVA